MSIEKITAAILDEAAAEREQILNVASGKSKNTIAELKKRIEIETEVAVKEAEEEKEKIISRRRSVADIDSKKIILAKKQELINRCFEESLDSILSMEEEKYIAFLAETGRKTGLTEGALLFNAKERDSIGQKVADALNQLTGGNFTLSRETRNLRGGYMLQNGQIFINNSLEAMVEEKRRDLTGEVAEILFGAGK